MAHDITQKTAAQIDRTAVFSFYILLSAQRGECPHSGHSPTRKGIALQLLVLLSEAAFAAKL